VKIRQHGLQLIFRPDDIFSFLTFAKYGVDNNGLNGSYSQQQEESLYIT